MMVRIIVSVFVFYTLYLNINRNYNNVYIKECLNTLDLIVTWLKNC
jgi:hypothetical protein